MICVANVRKNELTDFGRQVKNILSEKKITQSQLGETLGIAQNSLSTRLSRYEIGYDKMMDIANALGYEISIYHPFLDFKYIIAHPFLFVKRKIFVFFKSRRYVGCGLKNPIELFVLLSITDTSV